PYTTLFRSRGNRFRLLDDAAVKNRRGSRRLKTDHGRKRLGFSRVAIRAVTGPGRGDVSRVAERKKMEIGRVAEFVDNFEGRGFLSGDPIGIDRVHDREIVALPEFAHDPQRVIEVARDRDDLSAVCESLD